MIANIQTKSLLDYIQETREQLDRGKRPNPVPTVNYVLQANDDIEGIKAALRGGNAAQVIVQAPANAPLETKVQGAENAPAGAPAQVPGTNVYYVTQPQASRAKDVADKVNAFLKHPMGSTAVGAVAGGVAASYFFPLYGLGVLAAGALGSYLTSTSPGYKAGAETVGKFLWKATKQTAMGAAKLGGKGLDRLGAWNDKRQRRKMVNRALEYIMTHPAQMNNEGNTDTGAWNYDTKKMIDAELGEDKDGAERLVDKAKGLVDRVTEAVEKIGTPATPAAPATSASEAFIGPIDPRACRTYVQNNSPEGSELHELLKDVGYLIGSGKASTGDNDKNWDKAQGYLAYSFARERILDSDTLSKYIEGKMKATPGISRTDARKTYALDIAKENEAN